MPLYTQMTFHYTVPLEYITCLPVPSAKPDDPSFPFEYILMAKLTFSALVSPPFCYANVMSIEKYMLPKMQDTPPHPSILTIHRQHHHSLSLGPVIQSPPA